MSLLFGIAALMLAIQFVWRTEPGSPGRHRKHGFLFGLGFILALFSAALGLRATGRADLAEFGFLLYIAIGLASLYLAALFPAWLRAALHGNRVLGGITAHDLGKPALRGLFLLIGILFLASAQTRHGAVNAAIAQCADWHAVAATPAEREAALTRVPDPELRPPARYGNNPPYRCSRFFEP